MKIFSSTENNILKESDNIKEKSKRNGVMKHGHIEKKELSEQEIREKLATHVETSSMAKLQNAKKSEPLGVGFMNSDALAKKIVENKSLQESHILMTDVQLNDPNDSNTQEKLKLALRNGSFNFNPKEKEALEKILTGN